MRNRAREDGLAGREPCKRPAGLIVKLGRDDRW